MRRSNEGVSKEKARRKIHFGAVVRGNVKRVDAISYRIDAISPVHTLLAPATCLADKDSPNWS